MSYAVDEGLDLMEHMASQKDLIEVQVAACVLMNDNNENPIGSSVWALRSLIFDKTKTVYDVAISDGHTKDSARELTVAHIAEVKSDIFALYDEQTRTVRHTQWQSQSTQNNNPETPSE